VLQNSSSYYISLGRCLLIVLHVDKAGTDPVVETFILVYKVVDKFQKYLNW
jgi:hypothetical protein